MSPLKLNGSTSGFVALDAPAAAGSNTLTLPTGNGSNGQYLQTNGSGALSWATVTTGKILQVVSAVISTSTSTTSSSFVDTSVLLSITPTSASSNVLVMFGLHASTVSANAYLSLNLVRGSTTIFTSNEVLFAAPTANIDQYRTVVAHTYLDSPATTSSTTYKLQIKSHFGSTTVEVNRGGKSTITLMEVAA